MAMVNRFVEFQQQVSELERAYAKESQRAQALRQQAGQAEQAEAGLVAGHERRVAEAQQSLDRNRAQVEVTEAAQRLRAPILYSA